MIQNSLFICSVGLLFFLYSANPSGDYNLNGLLFSILLFVIGGVMFYKGNKQAKKDKEQQIQQTEKKKRD